MATYNELRLANRRAKSLQASVPRAIAAHYDRSTGRVVINLSSRVEVSFSPRDAQGLEDAKPSQLDAVELSPSGFGIHFPKLDADFYLPSLLEGLMGSRRWMAAKLGQAGGKSTSLAKKAAARANGRLGGRPKRAAKR